MSKLNSLETEQATDAAQVGKMFVTSVSFEWTPGGRHWDSDTKKDVVTPGHWAITAKLNEKPDRYSNGQTMTIRVEHGVGAKLVEVLLPVVIADASRKAQQLADESKAMLEVLGNRTMECLLDMPKA